MTYKLTPRADRIARLYAARARIEAEIRTLEEAELPDPEPDSPDPEPMSVTRRHVERLSLLRWASTPEFRERLATYGGPSGSDPHYRSKARGIWGQAS